MIGKTGTITWSNKSTSKVILKEIQTYFCLPSSYWLDYLPEETNKPVIHPDWGVKEIIKAPILLPEELFFRVFKADITEEDKQKFDYKLKEYIRNNFPEENWFETETTFSALKRVAGEQYIIDNYFNK